MLICDCGSTKAEWVLLNGDDVAKRFITNGFNPNFNDNETIKNIVSEAKNTVGNQVVEKIHFYGSGCGSEANQNKVAMIFAMVFKINDIEVYPDTLAACHALFGNNPGVACILGTGSNACVYDGEKITQSVVSLGFMIGDEGSGCHIGKRILHDYFLGIMPEDLRVKFDEKYHLDRETFLKNVYKGDAPSRYLAEFAKFAGENIENQYIKTVVGDCFEEFLLSFLQTEPFSSFRLTEPFSSFRLTEPFSSFRLERSGMEKSPANEQLLCLKGISPLPAVGRNDGFGFVGSIAFIFQDILLQILENHNLNCTKILKNPMDGLIEYYKKL